MPAQFSPAKFRAWRLRRKIGQKELAERLRYSRTLITELESGRARPTPRFLELFHRVFPDTDPAQFYEANGHER